MVTVPISRDINLKIDWAEFSKNLLDAGSQGLLTFLGGDGVSGGISALIAAIGSIKTEAEPGQKIWSLALLCFAWTLDELKADGATDVEKLRAALQDALVEARTRVDRGLETCPDTFLDRPVTLPLYLFLRDKVISKKHLFRAKVLENDTVLRARFDSAFNRSMFEILSKRPDFHQSIAAIFEVGGTRANDLEINWEVYRKRLIFDFDVKSIFGQEATRVSLGQLYIPLRGYWSKTNEEEDTGRLTENISATHDVGQLDEVLDTWVAAEDDEDWLRLIGGGPGSGKSTTLKALARRLADRIEFRTLFIPLQHIDLQGNLRDAVNNYFTEQSNSAFVHPPLSRIAVEDGPPLILIFDGLDELARPGEAANEVVNLFATKLIQLSSALRGDARKSVKFVVSGRMPSFQAARKYLSAARNCCIEVYGYAPLGADKDENPLWNIDQRELWWERYASLMAVEKTVPPAFSSPQLAGITHEPLLCYLLVLSGFATENWQRAADNQNRIYRTLIDSVWERGWGDGQRKRQGPGKSLSKNDFNDLMQTIALAAWHGGDTRVATEGNFTKAIKVMRIQDAWDSFTADNGTDVTNLAMNFYMKASESKQRGFEFTHKSFGDYLAARAILDFAEQLPIWINRNLEHAMVDWLEATGTGTLTHEILRFLRDEVRLRLADKCEQNAKEHEDALVDTKKAFEKLVSAALREGFPSHASTSTWRSAETKQRNAEIMAWAVLNSFALGLSSVGRKERLVVIDWPQGDDAFRLLLQRCGHLRGVTSPFLRCFSYIVAPNADFFGLSLSRIDLQGAQLSGSRFAGCHLINADLTNADLTDADFQRAMLDGADFTGASLKNANLYDARMEGNSLENADLTGARASILTCIHYDADQLVAHGVDIEDLGFRSNHPTQNAQVQHLKKTINSIEQIERSKLASKTSIN